VNLRKRFLPWLGATAVLIAGSGFWSFWQRGMSPMARLEAAARGDVRYIEARLSGGFRWAPLARATRGASGARNQQLLAVASTVEEETIDHPSSEVRHAAAIAHLLTNHPDQAIAQLASMAERSRDGALWNDLGAAYYQAALDTGSAESLNEALAATDQALLFDPALAESLFNRALILERFPLRQVAVDAWRDFLARNPASGWQKEAWQHLEALEAPVPAFDVEIELRYPRLQAGDRSTAESLLRIDAGEARYFGETEGLARWGEAWLRRDHAGAARSLTAIKTLSTELAAFNGEPLLGETVAAIERADPARRDGLARGHIGCRDGRIAYNERRMADAEQLLRKAARELESGGSPLSTEVRLFAGVATFWQGRHAEAEADFRRLLEVVPERQAALRALLDWQLATCFLIRSETGNSLVFYTRALDSFTRLHEVNNTAYLHDIVSQVYDGAGDHARAAEHRLLALQVLGRASSLRLVHALNGMVYVALQNKNWLVARSLLNVQVAVNAKFNDAELQITALLRRAGLHSHLGQDAMAGSDLRRAQTILASVRDAAHRAKLQNDCNAAAALVASDPRTAILLLTEVLRYHGEEGWRRLMPDLYLRRGRMYQAVGDHPRAAADFEAGILVLEQHRQSIPQGEQRWGVLDAGEELFDEAIVEALRAGAVPAFAYAERKRARSLSDAPGRAKAFDAAQLPPDTLLVEYAALPERLLVFAVSRSGYEVREVAIARTQLAALAARFSQALFKGKTEEHKRLASQLDELLIAPIRRSIASHGEIAFVTDAVTSGVAFAALPSGASGRMLVEDVTISVSPSARVYAGARLRTPHSRANILIVDSPANGALEQLTATSAEAQAVQRQYPHAQRLSGERATRAAFVTRTREADVIHFAGHGVTTVTSAALVLSATSGDSGLLDAASISRLDLRNTDVVVLAACDTANGPVRSAEGVLSVTHAFLQAGAPAVIATLWPLDDRDASRFFPRLHRHLARGVPAAEALRLAQIEWIRSSPEDRAALWAAVQVTGY
jgi:CHAT domain-containing protein